MSLAGVTYWPSMSDYQEAIQAPHLCFSAPDLSQGVPVTNKLGLPRPICGNFASVYELSCGGKRFAVKCFLRNIPDLHKRYEKIADHLARCGLPYFCTFEYQEQGIRVHGKLFPLVKMEWVEGTALNVFVEKNISSAKVLEDLAGRWTVLLADLRSAEIGHGDLQHGNVLVGPGNGLRLIDYDGMWVPKLKGQKTHETGHPDYQSPGRTQDDFDENVDVFAGEVIHIALLALQREPRLWSTYNNGDNLLFRRQDYLDPRGSGLFGELRGLGDPEITSRLDDLVKACGGKGSGGGLLKKKGTNPAKAVKAPDPAAAAPKPPDPAKAKKKGTAPSPVASAPTPPRPSPPPKAVAPPPKPAPAPAMAAARSSGPSWLSGTVTGQGAPAPRAPSKPAPAPAPSAAPAPRPSAGPPAGASRPAKPAPAPAPRAAPARRPRSSGSLAGALGGAGGILRLFLHAALLVPVAVQAAIQLVHVLKDRTDESTLIQMPAFSAATVLGLFSVLTLFVWRGAHAVGSTLFCGLVALLMLLNMVADLFLARSLGLTGHDPVESVFVLAMLLLGAAGLIVDSRR